MQMLGTIQPKGSRAVIALKRLGILVNRGMLCQFSALLKSFPANFTPIGAMFGVLSFMPFKFFERRKYFPT